MADNDKPGTSPEIDEEMEELKRQVANLKAAIAERADDATQALREQAAVVRENPATIGTVMPVIAVGQRRRLPATVLRD